MISTTVQIISFILSKTIYYATDWQRQSCLDSDRMEILTALATIGTILATGTISWICIDLYGHNKSIRETEFKDKVDHHFREKYKDYKE